MRKKSKPLDEEAVSPVIAVILMVAITVVLAAVLYVWAASFIRTDAPTPTVVATSAKGSDGYTLNIITVTDKAPLTSFHFYLKDETGRTYQEDRVGLIPDTRSDDWVGCDATWDGKADEREDENGGAYSNVTAAQARIDELADGQDDGGQYLSVTFYDNDFDGKLTAGDMFKVKGNQDHHLANDDYSFNLKYTVSGENSLTGMQLG